MNLFYFMGYLLSVCFLFLFHRLRIIGQRHIPRRGGIIVATNHASHLDPTVMGVSVFPRAMYFMARSTLFKPRWFGWLIHSVNARPVVRGRGPDQDWALFVNLVRKGKALLVFPEGTRTESGELQRGKSGFGRLVHLCQVPVYPAYIEGSYQAFPKGGKYSPLPIRVIFGKAVYLDDLLNQPGEKRIIREISERVLKAISGLKKELERQDRSKL